MAARSSGRPAAGVYLCIFGSAGASTAAPTMGLGVGGAGAPAPNPMTGLPAAFSALAFASTARVADSEMADTRADILVVGMLPWGHLRDHDHQLVSPWASFVEPPPIGGPRRRHKNHKKWWFVPRACAARQRGAPPGRDIGANLRGAHRGDRGCPPGRYRPSSGPIRWRFLPSGPNLRVWFDVGGAFGIHSGGCNP